MALPPGPRAPAIVQTLEWLYEPGASVVRNFQKYGDIFTLQSSVFGTQIVVSRPSLLKQIFTGDPDVYHAGAANSVLQPILGPSSVMLLDGRTHLRQRRLLLPAFHGDRMQRYTRLMRTAVLRATSSWGPGQRVALRPVFQQITLDVILDAVLGVNDLEAEHLRDALGDLLDRLQSPWGALWMIPALQKDLGPLTGYAAAKRCLERVDSLLLSHIARHRQRAGSSRKDDVLQMMLEAVDEEGQAMSDRELRDELVTLLIAGHETTVTSACWAFEEILRIPGEQDRLKREIETVAGSGPLEADHLPKLVRLDSIVKETLRLWPVFGAVERQLMKPITLDGYDLPAGLMVAPCAYLTHRRPDLYPDPERFIPDRFVGRKTDPYEWFPFGGGIRRCIGMAFALHEMKVIVGTIVATQSLQIVDYRPARLGLKSYFLVPKGSTEVLVSLKRSRPAGELGVSLSA